MVFIILEEPFYKNDSYDYGLLQMEVYQRVIRDLFSGQPLLVNKCSGCPDL